MPAYAPTTIAVTGATGQLGRAWLRAVAERHPTVNLRLLARRESPAWRDPGFQALLGRIRGTVTLIDGDLRALRLSSGEVRALTEADGGWWHFAAVTNLQTRSRSAAQHTFDVNRGGTAALLEICAQHPPSRFFHVSTAYVAGVRSGRVRETELNVAGPFRNAYEESKAQAEGLVRAAFAAGLAGLIFRPSLVLDESDDARGLPRLFAAALRATWRRGGAELVLRAPPSTVADIVSERFVIDAMLTLAARGVSGCTYHLTAHEPFALSKLEALVQRHATGFRVRFAPEARASSLDGPAALLDAALRGLRPYCGAAPTFDRTNLERDFQPTHHGDIDWPALVERHIGSFAEATTCPAA